MKFEYDRSTSSIVDHDTGETLKTIHAHPHADHSTVGIFDAHGSKTFDVTFWNRSIDHAPTLDFPDDGVVRKVVLSTFEFDELGRSTKVVGDHHNLSRILDYYRRSAEQKTNYVGFEFIDRRGK